MVSAVRAVYGCSVILCQIYVLTKQRVGNARHVSSKGVHVKISRLYKNGRSAVSFIGDGTAGEIQNGIGAADHLDDGLVIAGNNAAPRHGERTAVYGDQRFSKGIVPNLDEARVGKGIAGLCALVKDNTTRCSIFKGTRITQSPSNLQSIRALNGERSFVGQLILHVGSAVYGKVMSLKNLYGNRRSRLQSLACGHVKGNVNLQRVLIHADVAGQEDHLLHVCLVEIFLNRCSLLGHGQVYNALLASLRELPALGPYGIISDHALLLGALLGDLCHLRRMGRLIRLEACICLRRGETAKVNAGLIINLLE